MALSKEAAYSVAEKQFKQREKEKQILPCSPGT
jgi:hypothetical protein